MKFRIYGHIKIHAYIFRLPCGLGLWLSASILQLVVIGIPVLVFASILILYLAAQLHLYVEAACAASILGT